MSARKNGHVREGDTRVSLTRLSPAQSGLVLGVKACKTYEWRKTINIKKPVRSQHNRAKENNS